MWDYKNWKFNVTAISGDDANETIKLQLKKGAGDWQDCSEVATCQNITPTECIHCTNVSYYWLVNFTSAADEGTWFYRFIMNNTDANEIDESTSGTDSFSVTTSDIRIFLENVTQYPSSGSWGGGNFTFNVTVNTTGVDNVTVFLWTSNESTGPWSLIDQQNYSIPPGDWQTLNFSKAFSCDKVGTNWFFFNATNYNGTTNMSNPQSFTVTKDTVLFTYATGHNSTANRAGGQEDLLSFYVQDLNGTVLTSFPIKYSVTGVISNTTYYTDSNFVNSSNSTGYANFYFNPSCLNDYTDSPKFKVGAQLWKAEINDSQLNCYNQNDTLSP